MCCPNKTINIIKLIQGKGTSNIFGQTYLETREILGEVLEDSINYMDNSVDSLVVHIYYAGDAQDAAHSDL